MRKLILIIFLLLTTNIISVGQTDSSCKIPLHITVDSLNNYLMADYLISTNQTTIPANAIEYRKQFDYQKSQTKDFDSIRWCCENYLLKKLGKSVYCNYVDIISSTCCSIETGPSTKGFTLSYDLQLPNLTTKRVTHGWRSTYYELVSITFKLIVNPDSTLQIIYPTNVPDCKGLPDCGFIITKDKAIDILKKSGTLPDNINYSIEADGINWVIVFEDKEAVKTVKVNLQTGVQSEVRKSFRQ
jgi:hypothetical protein